MQIKNNLGSKERYRPWREREGKSETSNLDSDEERSEVLKDVIMILF